jgi:enamine deaminase RidA (YjgF/YER057c/UK114 family)
MYQHCEHTTDSHQASGIERSLMMCRPLAAGAYPVGFSVTWVNDGQAYLVASHQAPIDAARAAAESYALIAVTLARHHLEIVHERVFCSLSAERTIMAERSRALLAHGITSTTPITCIQGQPTWGEGLAGVIIQAVPAGPARTLTDGGVPCGRAWRSNGAEYVVLQNITGADDGPRENREIQVHRMLDRAERLLREQGGSYRDVVRTWFYLSDILEWYPEFNKARNEQYAEFGIMPAPGDGKLLLPASTGIRGDTGSGAAVTMDLLAVIGGPASRPAITQLTNSGQLDAFRYGAAFSRGALIRGPIASVFQLSGTAAIDEWGKSLFIGDIRGQITCTLDKVEALMAQAGLGLEDIVAATVFVKHAEHAGIFREMAIERNLVDLPVVCIVADICRDELLFEIDAEAVTTQRSTLLPRSKKCKNVV